MRGEGETILARDQGPLVHQGPGELDAQMSGQMVVATPGEANRAVPGMGGTGARRGLDGERLQGFQGLSHFRRGQAVVSVAPWRATAIKRAWASFARCSLAVLGATPATWASSVADRTPSFLSAKSMSARAGLPISAATSAI